jgi:hypothetical protein
MKRFLNKKWRGNGLFSAGGEENVSLGFFPFQAPFSIHLQDRQIIVLSAWLMRRGGKGCIKNHYFVFCLVSSLVLIPFGKCE